ncbi:MAG: hypothetical protein MK110_13545 [Fuerstiella sp.]|nr:hypothetical protein [Fuerstiella sp.]
MRNISACRVIIDPVPLAGSVNMAIDGALLQAADEQPTVPVVRVYRWSEPTVSLGYFQNFESSFTDQKLTECPRVRRITGGGAILHHHELTYSCVIPRTHPLRHQPLRLYEVVHGTIANLLESCGVSVGFRKEHPQHGDNPESNNHRKNEHFFCFLRCDPRDLVAVGDHIEGHPKVAGSAQRRRRGTILQHGSVLLNSSYLLTTAKGICNLFPKFDLPGFTAALPDRLANSIAGEHITSQYTDHERHLTLANLESLTRGTINQVLPTPDESQQVTTI